MSAEIDTIVKAEGIVVGGRAIRGLHDLDGNALSIMDILSRFDGKFIELELRIKEIKLRL